jgi:hypothetical protein
MGLAKVETHSSFQSGAQSGERLAGTSTAVASFPQVTRHDRKKRKKGREEVPKC